MQQLSETLGGLIIVTGAVLIVYFIARFTFLTKKMLAEKGMLEKRTEPKITQQDVAFVTIGICIGLLGSAGLSLTNFEENTMDFLSWGLILISGAMGLMMASRQKK